MTGRSYVRPTPRQRELLAAYVRHGGLRGAADELGITIATANQYMVLIRRRTGLTTAQAIYFGALHGWLTAPNS